MLTNKQTNKQTIKKKKRRQKPLKQSCIILSLHFLYLQHLKQNKTNTIYVTRIQVC